MIPPRKYQASKPAPPPPKPPTKLRLAWRDLAVTAQMTVRHRGQMWLEAQRALRALDRQIGPDLPLSRSGVALVAPYFGEGGLLPAFLRHHRELGVKEFVFLDLSRAGDLARRLEHEAVAVWRPRGAWRPERALHFLNGLRNRYATGRWCLSVNVTDLFVFYRSEDRRIEDLTAFLESESRRQIFALVLDMYGEAPASALPPQAAADPLSALPFFDPLGYAVTGQGEVTRESTVRGGALRRALYAADPTHAPPINRTPLIKWERYCAYIAETRLAAPYRLNTAHAPWHTSPTACLLRIALLSEPEPLDLAARVEAEAVAPTGDNSSYALLAQMRELPLRRDFSRRFASTADLVEAGLLNPGQWF